MNADRWKQIDELFDAVLDLPENERERFLTEKTDGDAELKNEVLTLLQAQSETKTFLEKLAIGIAAKNLAEEKTSQTKISYLNRKFGNYETESLLGSGGMGEVYLASDDKLNRKVALKILPHEFVADDERVKRFQGEARAISALNHPNIVTIYDVGNFENVNYIATEYVAGKTLREVIGSDVKLKEILGIITQCCDALAAAHAAGVIHRDIKPENIMIRPDGYVKILDFGLAKLTDISPQTFRNMAKTAKGIIIGTPAYMSPEQVTDDEVDHRTDLWSIGVVLYELLTGTNPFKKENRQATFQAILAEEPAPASSFNPEISPELDGILVKALEKDADFSYQTATDLRADLKRVRREIDSSPSLRSGSRSLRTERETMSGGKGFSKVWLVAVPVLLIAIAAGIWFFFGQNENNADVPNWTRAKNIQLSDYAGTEFYPSLSPDGKDFVFSMIGKNGGYDVFSQRVGGRIPTSLTENSAAEDSQPQFSSDGEFIAFRSNREPPGIYVMGASGENPRRVADFGFHPAWSPDGKEIAVSTLRQDSPLVRSPSQIWILNVETGEKRLLIDNFAVSPSWSPNGKRIAFWLTESGGTTTVVTISTAGGEPVPISKAGNMNWNPIWSPDGNFLYFASDRGGSMAFWRVRIDEETGQMLDEPEVVPTPAKYNRHLSFSRDGKRMIYVQTNNESNLKTIPFDMKTGKPFGEPTDVTTGNREVAFPELSPDGEQYVMRQVMPTQEDIVVMNKDGTNQRQLTDDKFFDRYPRWSSDGKKIIFVSDRGGKYEIWMINRDGTNLRQITDVKDRAASIPGVSPDGKFLSFDDGVTGFLLDLTIEQNENNPQALPAPGGNSLFRAWDWSPDGKKIAGYFERGELRGLAIYSPETKRYDQLSDFVAFNFWLPDNRRIIYQLRGKVYVADTETKKSYEVEYFSKDQIRNVRASRDGSFLYYTVQKSESDIWLLDLR